MTDPLIFDTSIWVDFLRNRSTPSSDLMTKYIEHYESVILVPTILQEVLQGIREDKQYNRIKEIFSYFTVLQTSAFQAAMTA